MAPSAYYQPSLQVPLSGKLAVALAAIVTLSSALAYAWASGVSGPMVSFLLAGAMACWLALVAGLAAHLGKIRHPVWMGRAGAGLGLLAWCVQWWASGEYAADGFTILLWMAECLLFVLPPRSSGASRARLPFCDEVSAWAKRIHVPVQFAFIDDPEAARRRLESDPASFFDIIGQPIDPESSRFSELTFYRCGGKTSFVTIENFVEIAPENTPLPKGMVGEKARSFGQVDEPVVELLRIPVADPDLVLRRWEEAAAKFSDEEVDA